MRYGEEHRTISLFWSPWAPVRGDGRIPVAESLLRRLQLGILWGIWIFYTKAFVFHVFHLNRFVQARTLQGIPELRFLYLGAMLLLAVLATARYRSVLQGLRRLPLLFWMVGVYVSLSVLWSVNPPQTFLRVIHFWSSSLLGVLLFVWHPDLVVLRRWLLASLSILLVSSLLFGVLFPENAVYVDLTRRTVWIGVFNYKNILGYMSAMTFLVLVTDWRNISVLTLPFRVFLAGLALALLFLSKSAGAQVFLLVTLFFWPFWAWLRTWSVRALVGFSGIMTLLLAGGLWMAWRSLPAVLAWLGKDATLSSRLPLWGAILWTLQHYGRLWIGMGQEAFFGGWLSPGSRTVWRFLDWRPMQAHNGYIQILADLGLLGVLLFLPLMALVFFRAFRAYRRDPRWAFVVLYLTLLSLMNLTESALSAISFYANMALWSLLVWILLSTDAFEDQFRRSVS